MPRIASLFLLWLLPLSLLADHVSASPAVQLIEQGDALKGKGEFEAAMTKYQEAVSKDPESAPALFKLAGMQLVQQQYAAAIVSFQRSLTLDPGNANAFVGMAVAYLHTGSYKLAEAALDEAVRLDPSKKAEVDKVRAWIDERSGETTVHGTMEGGMSGGAAAGGH